MIDIIKCQKRNCGKDAARQEEFMTKTKIPPLHYWVRVGLENIQLCEEHRLISYLKGLEELKVVIERKLKKC